LLLLGTCLLFAANVEASPPETVSPEWAGKWREDLSFALEELPEAHANLYHTISREELESAIGQLSDRLSSMAHSEIVVELARIVASIGDGHTRLTIPQDPGIDFFQGHSKTPPPNHPEMIFRQYPIRLYIYSDGLFVERIGEELAPLVGARVRRIGKMSADEAIEAVSPVVQRDNDRQLENLLPTRLVMPEMLAARGVIEDMDRAPFVLEKTDGETTTVELAPVPRGEAVRWVDARSGTEKPTPLYLRDRDDNFWFEYLEDGRTVYFQYNEVYDKEDETIPQFADRLFRFIDENPVDKLVIDLRLNPGGDNTLSKPLLHGLIRCAKVRQIGKLYTIIGRGTFSAAMMFAVDLEKHTNTIFVGEPTGSRPNHYGDSRKLQLPNSGVTIRASTLYWQYSDPRDDRKAIEPHISAALSSEDYRENRDPALGAILMPPKSTSDDPAGRWKGTISPGYQTLPIIVVFEEGDDTWKAAMDIPPLGATGLPLQAVRFETPSVRFELPDESGIIFFEAEIDGDRLIGEASRRGRVFPFVLFRE
jgi:hypothetical protein